MNYTKLSIKICTLNIYLKEEIEGMNMVLEIHVKHFEDLYQNVDHIL